MNEAPLTEDLVLKLLREWQPNDYLERAKLKSMNAPCEVGAELRMHRAGHDAHSIQKILRIRATTLVNAFNREMSREQHAHAKGLPIYDSPIRGG